jgi:hypothetical protein
MKSVGDINLHTPADLFRIAVRVFTSPFIWLGIGFLLVFFVQPASATSLGVVALLGHFALKEPIRAHSMARHNRYMLGCAGRGEYASPYNGA